MPEKKKPSPKVIELAEESLEEVQGGVDLAYGGDGHDVIDLTSPTDDAPTALPRKDKLTRRDPSRS